MYGKVQYRTPIPSHVPVKVNTVTCAGKGFVTPNKHDELPYSFYNGRIIIIINNEFCIVAFEPTKIRTNSALESNYLNLIFLERFHVIIYMSSFLLWRKLWESPSTLQVLTFVTCNLKKTLKKKSFLDKIG